MKYISALACVASLFLGSFASAALTKHHIIMLGAETVIANGDGQRVQSCSAIKDRKTLMACVADNTNVEGAAGELPNHAIIKGVVELSYFDDTGDCRMRIEIDATQEKVIDFETWHCY
ncbi:hypothetical protein ACES2L_01065 [Bdellovibrio bacteriovorus]